MANKFIQKARAKMEANGTVGALHRATGTPEGKNIPAKKIDAVESKAKSSKGKGGKMSADNLKKLREAVFAKNMKSIASKRKGK